MHTIVQRLLVIKYNIADFFPDAKISNHAFTVSIGAAFIVQKINVWYNFFVTIPNLPKGGVDRWIYCFLF